MTITQDAKTIGQYLAEFSKLLRFGDIWSLMQRGKLVMFEQELKPLFRHCLSALHLQTYEEVFQRAQWKEISKKASSIEIEKGKTEINGRTNKQTTGGVIGLTIERAIKKAINDVLGNPPQPQYQQRKMLAPLVDISTFLTLAIQKGELALLQGARPEGQAMQRAYSSSSTTN